jgi:hypothetical protein
MKNQYFDRHTKMSLFEQIYILFKDGPVIGNNISSNNESLGFDKNPSVYLNNTNIQKSA